MEGINARIGARIRLYRRAKKLTLIQLSAMIHKSKATLSKYETGDIAIDVETLYDIAAALDIRIEQLLDLKRLRAKLDKVDHPDWEIKTIWGLGYKLELNV